MYNLIENEEKSTLNIASYADALWARHAVFLPTFVGEEYCVLSLKSVCVGGYVKHYFSIVSYS